MPKLTTTSYVMLGLLALKNWSTYELAQQMRRSIHFYWPRAESKIYEEPKKLVAHGFATATRGYAGKRPRTIYAITREGRKELRRWLAEPGNGPVVEFEGLVKVLFADQADRSALLATLASLRAEAEDARRHHVELATDLAETGGPFPERLHVNTLVFKLMWEQTQMVLRWIAWAEDEVADWPEDASLPERGDIARNLREAIDSHDAARGRPSRGA